MILYEDLIKTPPLSSSFALLDVAVCAQLQTRN